MFGLSSSSVLGKALQLTSSAIVGTHSTSRLALPLLVSSFSSSSGHESTPTPARKQRPAKQAPVVLLPVRQGAFPGPSRKPAVLKPALHQWHLCSPLYDPAAPPPKQHLPPYAPERAKKKDYRAMMLASKPVSFHRNAHRRTWDQLMKNACHTWRRKAEQRAADAAKRKEYRTAVEKHATREQAWQLWCSRSASTPQASQ
jgi:hypothetical protein